MRCDPIAKPRCGAIVYGIDIEKKSGYIGGVHMEVKCAAIIPRRLNLRH